MTNETFTKEQRAAIINHMLANRAARGGIGGRLAVQPNIQGSTVESGVILDNDDAFAWLPYLDVPRVLEALKRALAASGVYTQDVAFDGTGLIRIGRIDDRIRVHVRPVRPATRGETTLTLDAGEAEMLHRALNVARHEIEERFVSLESNVHFMESGL